MLQLARMYLTVDDLDACQQQCVQLLKMDSENDDATVVSGDFFKNTFFLSSYRYSWFYIRNGYSLLNRFSFFQRNSPLLLQTDLKLLEKKRKIPFFSPSIKWDLSEQKCW